MTKTLRAPSRLGPAVSGGLQALSPLEVHREFAQPRCQATCPVGNGRGRRRGVAFLGCRGLCLRQNLVRRQHPIHRDRVALFRRTTQPQRSISTGFPRYLDLPPGNDFTANQTETFVAQGMPLPELIEPAQHLQFICVGQRNCLRQRHATVIRPPPLAAQSGARWTCLSVKTLRTPSQSILARPRSAILCQLLHLREKHTSNPTKACVLQPNEEK
jgi:hypothetical protein